MWPRRLRSALAAVAVVAASLGLAGCGGLVGSYLGTRQALRNAGFQSVSVQAHFASSGDRVSANVSVAAPPSENDVRDVASVVWNHVHQRFSLLTVTVKGTGSGQGQVLRRPYTFSQLEALFGARNPAWNQNTLSQAAERLGFAILGGIVVVIVGIAVIAVVIARRRRRLELASGGPTGPRPTGVPLWAPPSGPPPPAEWSPPPSGWSGSDPGWSPNPSPPSPAGPWPAGGPSPPPVPAGSWPDGGPSASVSAPAPPPAAPATPAASTPPAPWPATPPAAVAPTVPPAPAPWPRRPPPHPHPDDDVGWGPPSAPD